MTVATECDWEPKRTEETRNVERILQSHFERIDAYRYNSASIRLRVIDTRFEGCSREERDSLVEKAIEMLPEPTQQDIVTLFTFAPSELQKTPKSFREYMQNSEFDHPTPSML